VSEPVRVGEGGGGGEVVGGGEPDCEGGIVSSEVSGGAWAKSRDSEEGPAFGEEFDLERMGNKWDVGGRVVRKESSVKWSVGNGAVRKASAISAWGGPGCSVKAVGAVSTRSFASLSGVDFLEVALRFPCCEGCVQSSTSNM